MHERYINLSHVNGNAYIEARLYKGRAGIEKQQLNGGFIIRKPRYTANLNLRLKKGERLLLEVAAERRDMDLSDLVRDYLRRGVERDGVRIEA